MNNTEVKIKLTNFRSIVPTRGTAGSAGYDLYACSIHPEEALFIAPGETKMISTGIAMEIPEGLVGLVFARSGLSVKQGLRPANCVGVIDSDYRGEILVSLYNDSNTDRIVNYGDRIAQIVIMPFIPVDFVDVAELSDTARGTGGHGSTGV